MSAHRLLVLILIGSVVAACGRVGPTAAGERHAPAGPRFDGGVMYGSGNRGADSTETSQTTTATTTEDGRGGVMYGSGN